MADDWMDASLGDCVKFVSGGTPSKGTQTFWGGSTPWISAKDMKTFWVDDSEDMLTKEGVDAATALVPPRSTLILVRGMTLHNDVPIIRVRRQSAFNQDVKAVVPKTGIIDEYVPYLLLGNKGALLEKVDAAGHGTGRLALDALLSMPVKLPSSSEQRAIAHLLTALDDKIELNRRMGETLESIARTLFKSWFIDFDPVRAKAEGRRTGLSDDLEALFPKMLGDDGLPNGWRLESIYSFAEVIYGAPFASRYFNSERRGLPLIRVRDLQGHDPTIFTDERHPNAKIISAGDIVVGMDGEFRCHIWRGPPSYLNQRVCNFRPVEASSSLFPVGQVPPLFLVLSLEGPLASLEGGAVGTTVIHLGKKDIDTIQLVAPGADVLNAFGLVTQPLLKRLLSCSAERSTLADLRDTLLPKLISGELRIGDAENRIVAA
jgi:type I restriction enzyme S subunit